MKMILATLLLSTFTFGFAKATTVKVNCATPKCFAGGKFVQLYGTLNIVVSPTTGMTRVAPKSHLFLSIGTQQAHAIPFQGVYFGFGKNKYIEGSVDSDEGPFTTINLYFSDSSKKSRSFIQRATGEKIPLQCQRQ